MTGESLPSRRRRDNDVHKGTCGRILFVGGSPGLSGAIFLASSAALRCGAGLVTCAVPQSIHDIIEIKTTEAMSLPLAATAEGTIDSSAFETMSSPLERNDVWVIGPGMGRSASTTRFMEKVLIAAERMKKPHLIDADGLWHLAHLPEQLANGSAQRVLTPHAGETRRLLQALGVADPPVDEQQLRSIAAEHFASIPGVAVLKGPGTWIVSGKEHWQNTSGNPGLATAGTGDVLAGMIGAFLAHETPAIAARRGVWVHGRAGDEVAEILGEESLIASDLLGAIPKALRE